MLTIFSTTLSPSIALVVIPPAYPEPSPIGYIPLIFDSKLSSLLILIGEDVLLSTPHRIVLSLLNPFIFVPKYSIPSIKDLFRLSGNISFKLLKAN